MRVSITNFAGNWQVYWTLSRFFSFASNLYLGIGGFWFLLGFRGVSHREWSLGMDFVHFQCKAEFSGWIDVKN